MIHKFKPSSDCSICILDQSQSYHSVVRSKLVDYKKRFNESLADRLCMVTEFSDVPETATILVPSYKFHELPGTLKYRAEAIDSIVNLSHYDLRRLVIDPQVTYTKDPKEAQEWLNNLGDVFAYDCETAAIVHEGEQLDSKTLKNRALNVRQHELTMFSFADNETSGFVLSNEPGMEKVVFDFLTSTDKKVIMHNASFDMKIIRYRTGKFIKNFEDSALLAWTKLNHANTYLAKVGLKGLAGKVYKDWAVSADLFGIENKYNPDLIRYSGIDAMATMFVWNEFNEKE